MADFGLSKKINEETSKTQTDVLGIIPYIDPKKLGSKQYSLNKKSDVYSIGMLLWEISSGQQPFKDIPFYSQIVRISKGLRETPIPNTPEDYVKIYTGKYYYFN